MTTVDLSGVVLSQLPVDFVPTAIVAQTTGGPSFLVVGFDQNFFLSRSVIANGILKKLPALGIPAKDCQPAGDGFIVAGAGDIKFWTAEFTQSTKLFGYLWNLPPPIQILPTAAGQLIFVSPEKSSTQIIPLAYDAAGKGQVCQ